MSKSTTILVCVSPSLRGRDGLYDRYTTKGTTNTEYGSRLYPSFRPKWVTQGEEEKAHSACHRRDRSFPLRDDIPFRAVSCLAAVAPSLWTSCKQSTNGSPCGLLLRGLSSPYYWTLEGASDLTCSCSSCPCIQKVMSARMSLP